MSNVSLEKSIRTCNVNTGEAARIQSDRFLNPNNMVAIPWNGLNLKGQEVCPDSFYTKTPGADSAEDRIVVENALRPSYMSYVTLGAQGIDGDIYGNVDAHNESLARQKFVNSRDKITGNFGQQLNSNLNYSSCTVNAYENAMAAASATARGRAYNNNMNRVSNNKYRSGNW